MADPKAYPPEHTMTVRLPKALAEDLEAVARIEDIPISKAVRIAIYEHIKAKRADKDFQRRLAESLRVNAAILERLRG